MARLIEAEITTAWKAHRGQDAPPLIADGAALDTFFAESGNLRLQVVTFGGFAAVWREIEGAAVRVGLELTSIPFHDRNDDIESAVAPFGQRPGGGLIVLPTAII